MFEIGRRYRIVISDHEGEASTYAEVAAWEPPLLKLNQLGSYQIINTAAPQFVSAEPDDEAHHAARTAAAKDITDSFSIRIAGKDA